MLRRGRSYRVVFSIEAMSQVPAVGAVLADGTADLKELTVKVDEDEVEELATHDGAVRSALAAHDAAVRAELSQHDSDIKALLADLSRRQEEIIRLLLTPQGRRTSDLGSFPIKPAQASAPAPASTNKRKKRGADAKT